MSLFLSTPFFAYQLLIHPHVAYQSRTFKAVAPLRVWQRRSSKKLGKSTFHGFQMVGWWNVKRVSQRIIKDDIPTVDSVDGDRKKRIDEIRLWQKNRGKGLDSIPYLWAKTDLPRTTRKIVATKSCQLENTILVPVQFRNSSTCRHPRLRMTKQLQLIG